MYTVEHAKILDIPKLLELASNFWQESETYLQRPMDLDTVKTHLQCLICYSSKECVLVCKNESGEILGGFVSGITKEWFSATNLMAFDYCIFVSSNNRGGKSAYLLVKAFIERAKFEMIIFVRAGTHSELF